MSVAVVTSVSDINPKKERRNIYLRKDGSRTSLSLEVEFWKALELICRLEECDMDGLCRYIVGNYGGKINGHLVTDTAAIRKFCIRYFVSIQEAIK